MVKKETTVEELEDFELEEKEPIEEEEETIEENPEDVVEQFMKSIDEKLSKLTKAISINQKYIRELYATQKLLEDRQDKLHENFKLLLEDKK